MDAQCGNHLKQKKTVTVKTLTAYATSRAYHHVLQSRDALQGDVRNLAETALTTE
jgi:hypothetical protein